jgi:membrane protein required for colicin V production
MTVLDYVLLVIVALSALVGLWRGLVSEVVALLAWIVALIAAWLYASQVAVMLDDVIAEPAWRQVAGFALIFIGVLLLAAVLRFLLRELLRAAGLGPADRMFGTFFGIARGLAIAFVLVLVGGMLGMAKETWWVRSLFAPPLETAVVASKPWLPDVVAEGIRFR